MSKIRRSLPQTQTDINNHDRILPSQTFMRQFFTGDDGDFYRRLENVTTSVLPIKSVHEKWDIRLKPSVTYETFGSDLSSLYHLRLLIQLMRCQRVLEIGTYVGVSSLFLADAIGEQGRVTTIEVGAEFAEIARENFRRNGLQDRIELLNDDVTHALPLLRDRGEFFDMIFLDGDKENYGRLLCPLLDLLRPGGLLFVDDIFMQGDVLNLQPATDKGEGIRDLLVKVAALDHHARVILPYGNGQLLVLKPAPSRPA